MKKVRESTKTIQHKEREGSRINNEDRISLKGRALFAESFRNDFEGMEK